MPDDTSNVVITGLGVVTPIGIGVDRMWDSLQARRSGVGVCGLFAGLATPDGVCAEVKDFTDETARKQHLTAKELRKNIKAMCREIQLGVAAAMQALAHSGLKLDEMNRERLGVEYGANLMLSAPDVLSEAADACCTEPLKFDMSVWGERGFPKMEPLWLLRYLPNMPACHISITADARGPSNSLTLDDVSGCTVLAEARRVLQRNAADVMITGSTGTSVHPIKTLHYALWHDLAKSPAEPERRARPFELHRTGRVLGEGAGSFILEREDFARQRGATIYAYLRGVGSSCVTDRDGTPRYRTALANAMRSALRSAGLEPKDIGHINAHGLGTDQVDVQEAQAIHDVFGPELGRTVPVTAPKSYLGNAGSGAGMQELAASILGLRHGVIPATLNYETPDPRCELRVVTDLTPTDNRFVLKVNVTRAGQAAAVVVETTPA